MATDAVTVSPTFNGDSVPLTTGMIVRLKPGANNNVVRAQADSAAHAQGVNGVVLSGSCAPGGVLFVACTGRESVQIESGLTLSVGDTVYVSAATAGRGTNVAPGVVCAIGIVADTSNYARLGTVVVDVNVAVSGTAGTGLTSWAGAPNSGLTPATPTTGAVRANQFATAQWPLGAANRRVFLVDGVNGNDSNPGFLDAPTFPLSPATVAATAKKTLAGLAACFPRDLQGRIFELIIASGTYTDGLQTFMGSLANVVAGSVVRGTVTNSTANSTAFAGDQPDALMAGYVTATGMNAAGYNPTGTPTRAIIQCLQVGGGAPGFPAQPGRPAGMRIRFDAATATVALRNACMEVAAVPASDTVQGISFGQLPAVPTASDVFYIEEGGVICGASTIKNDSGLGQELQFVGVRVNGALSLLYGGFSLVGVGASGAVTSSEAKSITSPTFYTHPSLGAITSGGGFRYETTANFTTSVVNWTGFVVVGRMTLASAVQTNGNNTGTFAGSMVGAGLVIVAGRGLSAFGVQIGTALFTPPIQVLGPFPPTEGNICFQDSNCDLGAATLTGAGSAPAIRIEMGCYISLSGGSALTGSAGNNDVGMDLTLARNSTIWLADNAGTPTVTGALGDVRLAGNVIISWAAILAGKGITDLAGNRIITGNSSSTAGPNFSHAAPSVIGKFSGGLVSSAGGATLSYLADVGSSSVANQATPQRCSTSQRVISKLRVVVIAVSGTLTNAVTATLYKATGGGAPTATAMTVSIPSGSIVGFAVVDASHPILFADGDTYDVRLDDGTDATAGTIAVSAVLEGF